MFNLTRVFSSPSRAELTIDQRRVIAASFREVRREARTGDPFALTTLACMYRNSARVPSWVRSKLMAFRGLAE